ncbi:PAN2 [Candida metapsilosis]|uniref:PAN2-PAN3 deadenylation complex catalytic subunit PAN2 n=1 Tax=Candida metapsilosis TaxID=273372 RepID=A0A8H7ZE50_9ASCO|nr:PAN2 [Candida metapsilosis]
MDGWSQVANIPIVSSSNSALTEQPTIISTKFDSVQNLIWCGDSNGFIQSVTLGQPTSPYIAQLYPYTKFQTSSINQPISQILSHKDGILSLSRDQLLFNNRRGLPKAGFDGSSFSESDEFINLNSMIFNGNSTSELAVGTDSGLLKFDINKPTVLDKLNYEGKVSLINSTPKYLTVGGGNGSLNLFDPSSNSSLKTFAAHNGAITGLDIKGNYIATCGSSIRPRRNVYNQSSTDYITDPLVNIYDIRTMRALTPVAFPAGASSVRFHPKLPNIVIVASVHGQIHFIDLFDQTNVHMYQADVDATIHPNSPNNQATKLTDLHISDSGDFLMFNDGISNLHLWSMTNLGTMSKDFVNFPQSVERPDVINHNDGFIGIDDNVPLSIVGMPYYKESLLSNWPIDMKFVKETAKLPERIDEELHAKAEQFGHQFFNYDSLKYGPGNVVQPYFSLNHVKDTQIPKFLSEQNDDRDNNNSAPLADSLFQAESDSKIPKCYSRLQIQYSKFGVKDFDFGYYNRTESYCGLENHSDNSYINSLLQVYRFQPLFYNQVVNTLNNEWLPNDEKTIIDEDNPQGSSILNELGYLFDMMYKAKSRNVKTLNFSSVMNHDKQAEGLVNLNEQMNLNAQEVRELIISFNNYLLTRLDGDFKRQYSSDFKVTELTYQIEIKGSGQSCPIYDKQTGSLFSLEVITPPSNMLTKMSILMNPHANKSEKQQQQQQQDINLSNIRKNINILTYLDYSMNQFKTIPCQQHQHSHPHTLEIRTGITQLPPVLILNVNLTNEEFKIINNLKQWLVPEFYAVRHNNTPGFSFKPTMPVSNPFTKFELLGYVCEISHQSDLSRTGSHNLVSFVKINDEWIFFNDYLVTPIPEEEVFNLNLPWKKPVIVVYQESTTPGFEYMKHFSGNDSILYRDHFAGAIRESYKQEYKLLTREEAPSVGTMVAIDAEFVTMKPEQVEISLSGAKKLIKPKELSLARVSVLRGDNDNPLYGEAFIDDYIVHTETIYDYTTNFSGIEKDDLNFNKSLKNLVTLQTSYRKLWLLLNLGVVFIGHGLYTDFRTINLQVPQRQIRDTADLYYKPDMKRQLSLKFLAYVMLKQDVQTGNHDSIEDARTALLLYKRYVELSSKGEFESMLNHVYSQGNKLRFRVPEKINV